MPAVLRNSALRLRLPCFVTAELDEGPIIEQDVERVSHNQTAEDLAQIGRDLERVVLARAVRLYAEDRVLLDGKRTVIF